MSDEPSHDASDDDAHADGDPTFVDPDDLGKLAVWIDDVQAQPEGDARNMAALGLWHEMYGDDLVVL